MTRLEKLRFAALILSVLDVLGVFLCVYLFEQIRFSGKCGTWACTFDMLMVLLAVLSIPALFYVARNYPAGHLDMKLPERLAVRLVMCFMIALLLAYFIGFPVIIRLA